MERSLQRSRGKGNAIEPTERFSSRVENYVKYRPSYPGELIQFLLRRAELQSGSVVTDVGSGTGILSKLLLDHGLSVIGVEPNRAMREVAERRLGDRPKFRCVAGTAEATGLADASVDLVAAAQAFHWFDLPAVKREFPRVLKPGGFGALICRK